MVLPGSFRIGRFRVPVYGLFATAGLISALALSQRTARFRGLDANKLWDAGMFAVVAAFVASRALLIVTHLEASITFPMLMLTMPSLTYTGMLATAVLTFGFLRWQRIPVLAAMDAWAPCAALLAAVLQLGHFFEGTDAGMPTSLPWGVVTPGDSVLGRVHPVQLYAAAVALGLVEFLLIRLKRGSRVGEVAAWALMLGGAAVFLLDFVRQPVDSQSALPLEGSQFLAVAGVVAGAILWFRPPPLLPLSRAEVAQILEDFAEGRPDPHGWNQYEVITYAKFTDPALLAIQQRFSGLSNEFPPEPAIGGYCNDQGLEVILDYAQQLRNELDPRPSTLGPHPSESHHAQ